MVNETERQWYSFTLSPCLSQANLYGVKCLLIFYWSFYMSSLKMMSSQLPHTHDHPTNLSIHCGTCVEILVCNFQCFKCNEILPYHQLIQTITMWPVLSIIGIILLFMSLSSFTLIFSFQFLCNYLRTLS